MCFQRLFQHYPVRIFASLVWTLLKHTQHFLWIVYLVSDLEENEGKFAMIVFYFQFLSDNWVFSKVWIVESRIWALKVNFLGQCSTMNTKRTTVRNLLSTLIQSCHCISNKVNTKYKNKMHTITFVASDISRWRFVVPAFGYDAEPMKKMKLININMPLRKLIQSLKTHLYKNVTYKPTILHTMFSNLFSNNKKNFLPVFSQWQ